MTIGAFLALLALAAGAAEGRAQARPAAEPFSPFETARAGTSCKTVGSCREAVILWCGGYDRADGDSDGIPCENVCASRRIVERIRAEIGC